MGNIYRENNTIKDKYMNYLYEKINNQFLLQTIMNNFYLNFQNIHIKNIYLRICFIKMIIT